MAGLAELKAFGANVEEGVNRCVNNEAFYLKMVKKAAEDASYDDLERAIKEKDLDRAFEVAHALKGVLTNLALTPLSEPVSEMTELLRNRTDTDYSGYLKKIAEKHAELLALME